MDLATIAYSGPSGRIVAKNFEAAPAAPVGEVPVAAASPAIPLGSTVPFTAMRGAVSRNMVKSLSVPTLQKSRLIHLINRCGSHLTVGVIYV